MRYRPSGALGSVLLVVLGSACLPKGPRGPVGRGQAGPVSEAMPRIVIRPGAAARIALMDRYRYDDEMRRRMMTRPQVWVEEIPDVGPPEPGEGDPASIAEPSED